MPRVLLLIPDLRNPDLKGGIQVFNGYLVRALRDLGHRVRVIGVNDRPKDARADTPAAGVDLKPCQYTHALRKPVAAARLALELLRFRPDLVVCGHLRLARLSAALCVPAKVPMITITHGVELWNPSASWIRGAARSELVLGVSRYTCAMLLDRMPGYDTNRVCVFSNTFDEERFRPRPRNERLAGQLGIEPGDKVALTVCRIAESEHLKGYHRVLDAVPSIRERIPRFRYVLAGEGNDLENIRRLVRERGLEETVRTPGFVPEEDIVDLFNLCDVFVMPSRKEGFGIVFLEAMGCGKPVIAGNRDGSVDPLMDGEAGILIDPESSRQIADAVVQVLSGAASPGITTPHLLRERVVERYGFGSFTQRTEEIVERACRPMGMPADAPRGIEQ